MFWELQVCARPCWQFHACVCRHSEGTVYVSYTVGRRQNMSFYHILHSAFSRFCDIAVKHYALALQVNQQRASTLPRRGVWGAATASDITFPSWIQPLTNPGIFTPPPPKPPNSPHSRPIVIGGAEVGRLLCDAKRGR